MKITITPGTKVVPTFATKDWLGTGIVDEVLPDGRIYVLWKNGMEGAWDREFLKITR